MASEDCSICRIDPRGCPRHDRGTPLARARRICSRTHEGWSNRATWAVNLWLSNDEGLYMDVLELAEEARRHPTQRLDDAIKDYVDELLPDRTGLEADLIQTALADVDWREIADGWAQKETEGVR